MNYSENTELFDSIDPDKLFSVMVCPIDGLDIYYLRFKDHYCKYEDDKGIKLIDISEVIPYLFKPEKWLTTQISKWHFPPELYPFLLDE